jgi:hypothetical protein
MLHFCRIPAGVEVLVSKLPRSLQHMRGLYGNAHHAKFVILPGVGARGIECIKIVMWSFSIPQHLLSRKNKLLLSLHRALLRRLIFPDLIISSMQRDFNMNTGYYIHIHRRITSYFFVSNRNIHLVTLWYCWAFHATKKVPCITCAPCFRLDATWNFVPCGKSDVFRYPSLCHLRSLR